MELHSPIAGKRLWSYLRVAFLMLRKSLISKRKLIMDINLMIKQGKLVGKTLSNHAFNQHRARQHGNGYGLQEHEFSCNNSPNQIFFHAKCCNPHNYFPCMGAVVEEDDEWPPTVGSAAAAAADFPILHYSHNSSVFASSESEEEEESEPVSFKNNEVDDKAEEFIRRFYEQLRRQSRFALLQYEMDYQEMLARWR